MQKGINCQGAKMSSSICSFEYADLCVKFIYPGKMGKITDINSKRTNWDEGPTGPNCSR